VNICTYNWDWLCGSERDKVCVPLRRESVNIDNSGVVNGGGSDRCGHRSRVNIIGRHSYDVVEVIN